MSHTMNLELKIMDMNALGNACSRLNYEMLPKDKYHLYETIEEGFGVKIPGMKYPVIIRADGSLACDDYDWTGQITGRVGARMGEKAFWPLLDAYGIEKAKADAMRLGYSTYEYRNEQNELELKIVVGE